MDIQQHIPIKIGFPPVLISFIILVFKPIAAIAIIIKNFDNCLKKANIETEIERLRGKIVKPTKEVNEFLEKHNTTPLTTGTKMAELLKRTELTYDNLEEIDKDRPSLTSQEKEEVEIQIKYEGYIKMQEAQVEKFKKLEQKLLPEDIDYNDVKGISLEARQKLNKFKPHSIGQASRISGVSPADISVLLIFMQSYNKK